uniref:Tektin n=1 Tax=Loa loa TaxID=7209 RepID=A0A1I7VXB7_LOALO
MSERGRTAHTGYHCHLKELEEIAKRMAERLLQLENEHYDINYAVRQKDFEINELTISVNDLRGKL